MKGGASRKRKAPQTEKLGDGSIGSPRKSPREKRARLSAGAGQSRGTPAGVRKSTKSNPHRPHNSMTAEDRQQEKSRRASVVRDTGVDGDVGNGNRDTGVAGRRGAQKALKNSGNALHRPGTTTNRQDLLESDQRRSGELSRAEPTKGVGMQRPSGSRRDVLTQSRGDEAPEEIDSSTEIERLCGLVNKLKGKVRAMESEKKVLVVCSTNLQERNDALQTEITELKSLVSTMQSLGYNRKGNNNSKSSKAGRKKNTVETESIENSFGGLHQAFIGVQLFFMGKAQEFAFLEVTESIRLEVGGKVSQERSWTGRLEELSGEDVGGPIIQISSGQGAVPRCPMELAKLGEFFTMSAPTLAHLVGDIVLQILDTDVGAHIKTKQHRQLCVAELSSHGKTVSGFRSKLRNAIGTRKKAAKNVYLKELGYMELMKSDSCGTEGEARRAAEASCAKEKIIQQESGEYNVSRWRTAKFSDIVHGSVTEETSARREDGPNEFIDKLFNNEPARHAFHALRGFEPSADDPHGMDATIMNLARADAWMTTVLTMAQEPGGRGGKRHVTFKMWFDRFLPLAVEEILGTCRAVLEEKYPEELSKPFNLREEKRKCLEEGKDVPSVYDNQWRKATVTFQMPSSRYDYVALTASWFNDNICSWMGTVRDCYVGRSPAEDIAYHPIKRGDVLEDPESSDESEDKEYDDDGESELEYATARDMERDDDDEEEDVAERSQQYEIDDEESEEEYRAVMNVFP